MRNWFRPWIHGKPHGMTNKTTNRIDRNKEKSNCKCSNGYILKIPPFHVVVIFVFFFNGCTRPNDKIPNEITKLLNNF